MKYPGLTKRIGAALNTLTEPSTTPIALCDDQCGDLRLLQIMTHNHAKQRDWKVLTRTENDKLTVWRVL